jgi:hypothetical protein
MRFECLTIAIGNRKLWRYEKDRVELYCYAQKVQKKFSDHLILALVGGEHLFFSDKSCRVPKDPSFLVPVPVDILTWKNG